MDIPDDAADMTTAAARADQADRLRKQHRAADAEASYRAAIALDPQLPRAHSGLGLVLRDTRRYAEAEAACREAIRLDPGYAPAHSTFGVVLRETRRYAEAEAACREAIRLDPDLAAALPTPISKRICVQQRSSWLKRLRMPRRPNT